MTGTATVGVVGLVMFCLGLVLPASASPEAVSAKPASPITTMGVGWHNEVSVPRALYQCPTFNCNQGQAYPGNDLAEICILHTGFIPINQLIYADPPQSCATVGNYSLHWGPTLYQCPTLACNASQAAIGDAVVTMCIYTSPSGQGWTWALNRTHYIEGFILHYKATRQPSADGSMAGRV